MTCLNLPDQSASLLSGGTLCKGNLVPSRSKLHIKYLEPRRSFGPKGVPRPLLEPYCYHSYRQHHGGCLFKEGESKSGPLCALLWRILTWYSRKQAQVRHIPASTMSCPGIHCVETQCLVLIVYSKYYVSHSKDTNLHCLSNYICCDNCRNLTSDISENLLNKWLVPGNMS